MTTDTSRPAPHEQVREAHESRRVSAFTGDALGTLDADDRQLVIADIPGLIEGAADGAGLGAQFLRHLQRTRLLLHLVDIAPMAYGDEDGVPAGGLLSPAAQVRALERELERHDPELLAKPRWLVLNKADLLPPDEARALAADIVAELDWQGPRYLVSAIGREGTWPIMLEVQAALDRLKAEEREAGDAGA